MSFAALKRELADAIKAREIGRLVYFHTDHFEPWKKIRDRSQLSRENVDDLVYFTDRMQHLDYARRLSLFYRNVFPVVLGERDGALRADPDDRIGFMPRSHQAQCLAKEGMGYLAKNSQHELQVHIHHEGFTFHLKHRHQNFVEYFQRPEARMLDDARLDFVLKLHLDYFARETERKLDKWFFVHGQWGLNASDPDTCWITREIEILMKHGCKGDFTFPAGRKQVNPQHKVPYFCDPVNAPRGYDHSEAHPEFAYGNGGAADKFFIWASKIDHRASAIDYYVPWVRQKLEDPLSFAKEMVENSFSVDGRLYVKTHCHSLHPEYFTYARVPVFPHEHPGIQGLLGLLFDAASDAGVAVEFATVSEVYDQFTSASYRPAAGYSLTANGDAGATCVEHAHDDGADETDSDLAAGKPEHDIAVKYPLTIGRNLFDRGRVEPRFVHLQQIARRIVSQRLTAMGKMDSGAHNHYQRRLERNDLIGMGETVIAEYLLSTGGYDRYIEIGSGFGLLPILLAMRGLKAVGVEGDRARHATALALLAAVQTERPAILDKISLTLATVPAELDMVPGERSLAVMCDFMSTALAEKPDEFGRWLGRFDGLLIEADRFLVRRQSTAEQQSAVTFLERHGFGTPREIFDLSLMRGGHYYLFVKRNSTPVLSGADNDIAAAV